MKCFFITGTDTEVGKTLIAAALIYKLQEQGFTTCGFKPVVAGMQSKNNRLINEDLDTLLLVSNRMRDKNHYLTYDTICPYRLSKPAAPHLVAKHEGVELNSKIMLDSYNALQEEHNCIIVEGAGGFLVPINEFVTLGDFAKLLELPVILVVDIRLGCINHALLTAAAIQSHQLVLKGWIANTTSSPNIYYEENIQTLKNILQAKYHAPLLGTVPYQSDLRPPYNLTDIQSTAGFLDI